MSFMRYLCLNSAASRSPGHLQHMQSLAHTVLLSSHCLQLSAVPVWSFLCSLMARAYRASLILQAKCLLLIFSWHFMHVSRMTWKYNKLILF